MIDESAGRRIIHVNGPLVGPGEPKLRFLRVARVTDFPAVAKAQLEMVKKLSSPLLMGPPICEELVALVCHLFTEEEADVARHLQVFRARTAEDLARAAHCAPEDARKILDRLAVEKRAISSSGPDNAKKYKLMPIFPGIFEMVLIGVTPDKMTDWHRRFAELFELLYDTGYPLEYMKKPSRMVRFLPVRQAIEAHPMALPSDRMEVILDQFKEFGVGQCQCRMSAQINGHGCGKALGNCISMGLSATKGIRQGWLKPVERKDVLEIKAAAEADGMVNWMFNVANSKMQHSCSCCGCCCKAMRLVNEFNAPGVMAPPHFRPRFNPAQCQFCARCVRKCPMGALTMDVRSKRLTQKTERCIGCGLCAVACDRHAIAMEPVPEQEMPYQSFFSMLMRTTPSRLWTSWKVWKSR